MSVLANWAKRWEQWRRDRTQSGRLRGLRCSPALIELNAALAITDVHRRHDALKKLGASPEPASMTILVRYLDDERTSDWERIFIADAIGLKPCEQILPLIEMRSSRVRVAAAKALGVARNQAATSILLNALSDVDHRVVESAIRALGSIRDERAVMPLISRLEDYARLDTPALLKSALETLAAIGDRRAVEPLIALHQRHHSLALAPIAQLGGQRAVEYLIGLLPTHGEPSNLLEVLAKADWRAVDIAVALRTPIPSLGIVSGREAIDVWVGTDIARPILRYLGTITKYAAECLREPSTLTEATLDQLARVAPVTVHYWDWDPHADGQKTIFQDKLEFPGIREAAAMELARRNESLNTT